MKKMKIILLALLSISALLQAQPRRERVIAKRVLKKTAFVIVVAHKKVKENKNFTGDLSKAVAHQRFAKKLFIAGRYKRAVHQSRLARAYAIRAIKANKGVESADLAYAKEDEELLNNAPTDAELENELLKEEPNQQLKDEDLIKTDKVDVDVE